MLQHLLPSRWKRMEVVPCPLPPPESSRPTLPLPRGLGSGSPESDSGLGRMCWAGLWQKCTAVVRWRRPPKSRPHCATEYNKKQIISQNQCCCSRGMHTCTHSRPTSLKDLRRKHQCWQFQSLKTPIPLTAWKQLLLDWNNKPESKRFQY